MAKRSAAIVLRKLAEESGGQLKAMVTELEGNRVEIEGKPTGWAKRFKASGKKPSLLGFARLRNLRTSIVPRRQEGKYGEEEQADCFGQAGRRLQERTEGDGERS